jgi:hypothetical protein
MPTKRDISAILKDWPFVAGQVNARLIDGADGAPRIQVRLDLGLLQMHADGRPDGEHPFGFSSLLEYHEARIDGEVGEEGQKERQETGASTEEETAPEIEGGEVVTPSPEPIALLPEECRALREEAAQYYQRYVACLALEDFDRVIRDTTRNLRVLDMCAAHARSEQDKGVLEQFRPYIIMLRARALASRAIRENELKAAVVGLDEALDALRRYFTEKGQALAFEQSSEVRMLRDMREALVPRLPVSQAAELRERLQRALETENYELAAILRDEIKQLKK